MSQTVKITNLAPDCDSIRIEVHGEQHKDIVDICIDRAEDGEITVSVAMPGSISVGLTNPRQYTSLVLGEEGVERCYD